MTATKLYEVVRLRRDPETADATDVWKDFELRDTGTEPSVDMLDDPRVSLFSLDRDRACAVFVEAEEPRVLAGMPFYYMAQRMRAKRVLMVSLDTFFRLYSDCAMAPDRLLHLYSVGRCGSTLLHHALNQVDTVTSLSEPDVLYQIALWRKSGRIGSEEAVRLAGASLRCLWRKRPAGCDLLAVKHRGKSIWAYREFWESCPDARSIFLYRNAVDTLQSFDRMSGYAHGRRQWLLEVPFFSGIVKAWIRLNARKWELDIYREHLSEGTPVDVVARCGPAGRLLLDWISKVDCYMNLRKLDPDCIALRYEDMIAAPHAVLVALFAACGLAAGDMTRVTAVFAKDSQEGTPLQRSGSRSHPLSAAMIHHIQGVIGGQTGLPKDLILPGTLTTG